MHMLITYDIATSSEGGTRRLRRVAKIILDYGQRVQFSVFECQIGTPEFIELKQRVLAVIDKEQDSVRFYNLGAKWDQRVEHYGIKDSFDPGGPLIV